MQNCSFTPKNFKTITDFFNDEMFNLEGKLAGLRNILNKYVFRFSKNYAYRKIEKNEIARVSEELNNLYSEFTIKNNEGVSWYINKLIKAKYLFLSRFHKYLVFYVINKIKNRY